MFNVLVISLLFAISAKAERNPQLPAPFASVSTAKMSTVIGWPEGKTPIAPLGFSASEFARLESPRSLLMLPSGNVLVSQAKKSPGSSGKDSPNKISLLKIRDGHLMKISTFAENLELPFGMAVWKNQFFVAEPTRILVFPYHHEKITGSPKVIATLPFPKPQRHWSRHLLLKPDGSKLYVSVGSASNVGEDGDPLDPRNAAILEMNLAGSQQRIFANGLRNPVSMAWEPQTQKLWAVVNERDEMGDDLVPDYITPVVENGFYGWPYSYWGKNVDPRRAGEHPELVSKSITPFFSVGSHVAALGITFSQGTQVPKPFSEGAFIAEHGSWNRSQLSGYKVIFVGFTKGEATDREEDFLTGFIADEAAAQVYGRPVATVILKDGSILVSDDAGGDGGGKIWQVQRSPQAISKVAK